MSVPEYTKRLNKVIPGGCHTYSRGADQFPDNAPQILNSGQGAYVYDEKGNKYLDYGMGLRAVSLGYAHREVNDAAKSAIDLGNCLTRASLIELEAAEKFVDSIASAEMVKFCKNGSNATTAAIKLARAATGRERVCVPAEHPFFSFDDWFIGETVMRRGVPAKSRGTTHFFNYGNLETLESIFNQYPGEIAAVMLEPATTVTPCTSTCSTLSGAGCKDCPNKDLSFLSKVRRLCDAHNVVLIFDEMITGFRWYSNGGAAFFNVQPDLSTHGKAMANGFSLAALAGRRDLMELGGISDSGVERTFLLSSTHGAEMCSLAAYLKVQEIHESEGVCEYIWSYGGRLQQGLNSLSKKYGLSEYLYVNGPGASLSIATLDANQSACMGMRTVFLEAMLEKKVLIPWIAQSFSHTNEDLEITLEAFEFACRKYLIGLESGWKSLVNSRLIVKPVFRKFN